MELTSEVGYQFIHEYSQYLLFENKQVSGGGIPSDYELISKNDGSVVNRLGPILFFSEAYPEEVIVRFKKVPKPALAIYDLMNGAETIYEINTDKKEVLDFMNTDDYPENHFWYPKFVDGFFTAEYMYKDSSSAPDWHSEKISIRHR